MHSTQSVIDSLTAQFDVSSDRKERYQLQQTMHFWDTEMRRLVAELLTATA